MSTSADIVYTYTPIRYCVFKANEHRPSTKETCSRMKPVLNRDMQTLNYDIIIGFKLSYGVPLFILVTTNELSNCFNDQ